MARNTPGIYMPSEGAAVILRPLTGEFFGLTLCLDCL